MSFVPYDPEDVRQAIARLESQLSITLDEGFVKTYFESFESSNAIAYEKVDQSYPSQPAIQKYLMGAHSYSLGASTNRMFDIYRFSRIVPLVQSFSAAIDICASKGVGGLAGRLDRLSASMKMDDLDAGIFEVVCAARYADSGFHDVQFIPETDKKTPDLSGVLDGQKFFVECKKLARFTNFSGDQRVTIRKQVEELQGYLYKKRISAYVEIEFLVDPGSVTPKRLREACKASLEQDEVVAEKGFVLRSYPIVAKPLETFTLYPSPQYFKDRYNYVPGEDWQGIVLQMGADFEGPGWLDEVHWESAVKWRVSAEDAVWKCLRIPHSTVFDGLKQLENCDGEKVLHVCYERDLGLGHRRENLLKFVDSIKPDTGRDMQFVVFNELEPLVNYDAKFEFLEHAHVLGGPAKRREEPPVTLVFVDNQHALDGIGEWGVGQSGGDITG